MTAYNEKLSKRHTLRLLTIDTADVEWNKFRRLQSIYEIVHTENANDGLSLARKLSAALVIVHLPFQQKSVLNRSFKTELRPTRTPVLAIISRHEMMKKKGEPSLPECDDFILSPFEEIELLQRVNLMLHHRILIQERYVNFMPENVYESVHDRFINQVKAIIEQNLHNPLFGVAELVVLAGVSQAQLYRRVVALTGMSPNNYIRHIRLKHADYLLSNRAGNVSEIAYRVGFNSQSYFAKCFKAAHRYSPKQAMG